VKVRIFTENAYGPDFIKRLIKRLKERGAIPADLFVNASHFLGVCRPKSGRQIGAAYYDFDSIIVIVDAHGGDANEVEASVIKHVHGDFRDKLRMVILDYEIEEWVCRGLNIRFGQNPSEDLSSYLRRRKGYKGEYKKHMLPEFADEVNIERLMEYPSFKRFLKMLRE